MHRLPIRLPDACCRPPQPAPLTGRVPASWLLLKLLVLLSGSLLSSPLAAAEIADCQTMLLRGQYAECIAATTEAINNRRYGETWPLMKIEAQMSLGHYPAALQTVDQGIDRYSWSIRLRWLGRDAARRAGLEELAQQRLVEIQALLERFPWRYTDAEELVMIGQYELERGADAREVLVNRFDKAKDRNRRTRGPWLAIGQMGLDKNDNALAAETFREALEVFPDDPDFHFGLSQALSDSAEVLSHINAALSINAEHVPTLLLQADRLISAEAFDEADELLARVLAVNEFTPEAWAYRAVIAHLTNDPRGEAAFRAKALARWESQPAIDHLIGRKLSQAYRFREGAAYQRRALQIDAGYVPAQRQLAQDLLRLGSEDEGWQLADAAHQRDQYSVATFNLLELRDELQHFTTLESELFILRMEEQEAQLYGDEVLTLLERAHATLNEKYGLDLPHRITVEVFPDENDFAVRTFGMPAVSGYLGVCFGRVITANSSASRRENPSNWEAILWHEYCHVVTLELTGNRIPRWLSEGISVYEELQASPAWGQRMSPRYREHILDANHTPLSQLSRAFMNPPSGWHLQFAYFESALAVEFLIDHYGLPAMRNVLQDLRSGLPLNAALDRRCDAIEKLEAEFDAFLKQKAEALAPQMDWSKPELDVVLGEDNEALDAWVRDHPTSFVGLSTLADRQIRESRWADAEQTLRQLINLYPDFVDGDNPYEKLAGVFQKLNKPMEERAILNELLARNGSAVAAALRLLELHTAAEDWPQVLRISGYLQSVDPLQRAAHTAAATAAERLGNPEQTVKSLHRVALLEPDDPADVEFRLARALHSQGRLQDARRHVLKALEEAPRYREAHRLLLQIIQESPSIPADQETP